MSQKITTTMNLDNEEAKTRQSYKLEIVEGRPHFLTVATVKLDKDNRPIMATCQSVSIEGDEALREYNRTALFCEHEGYRIVHTSTQVSTF